MAEHQRQRAAAARRFRWEHLLEKRLFALTADGKTEYRRDSLTRYLVVEPDPTTGTIKPVLKWGRPVYLLVCREEREARERASHNRQKGRRLRRGKELNHE